MSMNNTESKEFEMSSITKNKIMLIKTDEITFLKIINNSKLILLFFYLVVPGNDNSWYTLNIYSVPASASK